MGRVGIPFNLGVSPVKPTVADSSSTLFADSARASPGTSSATAATATAASPSTTTPVILEDEAPPRREGAAGFELDGEAVPVEVDGATSDAPVELDVEDGQGDAVVFPSEQ